VRIFAWEMTALFSYVWAKNENVQIFTGTTPKHTNPVTQSASSKLKNSGLCELLIRNLIQMRFPILYSNYSFEL
jgi:hypothetical protein